MENKTASGVGLGQILKTAYGYWSKFFFIHFIYSLLYFSLFFIGYFYLFKYFGLLDEVLKYRHLIETDVSAFNKKIEEIVKLPQARNFALAFFGLLAFINPLNIGLYRIYRKSDLGEKPAVDDLFTGYRGLNFFRYFGFYLFWIIIFSYANSTLILGIVWILITLFSVPLSYFQNVDTFRSIGLTISALRLRFADVIPAVLVALLFTFGGALFFGIGLLLTFPFWHAMIYTLYQKVFTEKAVQQ